MVTRVQTLSICGGKGRDPVNLWCKGSRSCLICGDKGPDPFNLWWKGCQSVVSGVKILSI